MVSKDVVVQYLQLLLEGADLESTSEDSLKRMLKSYFIQDTSQYDADVQEEIQKYIILQSQFRLGKRLREEDERHAVPYEHKHARTAESRDPRQKDVFRLTEDGRIRCVIRDMPGTPVVEIRAYYPESGKMIPTREGVHLTRHEWTTLSSSSHSLYEALSQADMSYKFHLGPSRVVTLSADSTGAATVSIAPGASIPGNPEAPLKGITLPCTAFQALSAQAPAISEALGPHSSRPAPPPDLVPERIHPVVSAPPPATMSMPAPAARVAPTAPESAQPSASMPMPAHPARVAPTAPVMTRPAPAAPLPATSMAPVQAGMAPRPPSVARPPPSAPSPSAHGSTEVAPAPAGIAHAATNMAPRPPSAAHGTASMAAETANMAQGATSVAGNAAMAPGAAPRPAKRKRVRSKRHKPGGAAVGAAPGAATQGAPAAHAPAPRPPQAVRPAAQASGTTAAPAPAPPQTQHTCSARPAGPGVGAAAAAHPAASAQPLTFTAQQRPAAPASAAAAASAASAAMRPAPPASAPPPAMHQAPPKSTPPAAVRPVPPPPDVAAAAWQSAQQQASTAASAAAPPAPPLEPKPDAAVTTASAGDPTTQIPDLTALVRASAATEAAQQEALRNRTPNTVRAAVSSFEALTRELTAALAAMPPLSTLTSGTALSEDMLAAYTHAAAVLSSSEQVLDRRVLSGYTEDAGEAFKAAADGLTATLANLKGEAPPAAAPAVAPQATHRAGEQCHAASGGALWVLGVREGADQMCVHVHRDTGHVVVALGGYRMHNNARWSPARRGATLTLGQFNGLVVSHKRVSVAVRNGSSMETRLSPEWRLFVANHMGKTTVSVRRAAEAAKAASRRGAKGATLTADEWLTLDSIMPKVKASINNMKEKIKHQQDAAPAGSWIREQQDGAGGAGS